MEGTLKLLMLLGRPRSEDGRTLVSLIDRLARRGVLVQLVCPFKGSDFSADPRTFEYSMLGKRWLRAIAVRRLLSDHRLVRPDLLHVVHDEMADVALALAETGGFPYVQSADSFSVIERGLRLSRRWCRRIIAACPDLLCSLATELGVPVTHLALVPPGILAQHDPSRKAGIWKLPVIGAGGPLEDVPGLFIFLEAARMVTDAGHDVEFVIAGHRRQQADLRLRALRLQLTERVTVSNYPLVGPQLWSVLDIFCQPAVSANTGVTLMHALARGLPCIAADVEGLRKLIEPGETGVLVPPGDPSALHEAMVKLLNHPAEARRLGQNALDRARTQFDLDVEADRLADLYRQVICAPKQHVFSIEGD